MNKAKYRASIAAVFALCAFLGIARPAEDLPARLSDEAFWKLVTDLSEPGGRFISDNFVSNELRTQHVLADLTKGRTPGGVYLGVGPEQNFTYIAALQPKIAFIFDIRRQNMIEHLMYKALIELSADRADFVSRLFSRARPPNAAKNSTVTELFAAFRGTETDVKMYERNMAAIKDRLINVHGFTLTKDDESSLEYVFSAFLTGGFDLGYRGPNQPISPATLRLLPTYEDLMMDTDEKGQYRSFLATPESFETVQQLEKNNLIVPLVGDFAGPTAIRSVADYLKKHNATVTAFYVSNVEQYLFMEDGWKGFYANVATLPLDSTSVFIRPLINTGIRGYDASPVFRIGYRWDTMLFPIRDLLEAFDAGTINTYYDVIQTPN